jgi:hypothetical protein
VLLAEREVLKEQLVSGNQISYENTCTWHLSISARLDTPDAPLPADAEINVQIYASKTLADEVGQAVLLERLPPTEKAPVIAGAEDTVLKLADVLNPAGLLRLTGADLFFEPGEDGSGCVIEGTRSGRAAQSRFGQISNAVILFAPEIPAQTDPWNNEYQVSVSTRYTEHGTLRTGTYSRLLRSPLAVRLQDHNSGILSGGGNAALVTVSGGTLAAADTARVRIQAVLDARSGALRLNLLDMSEGGATGAEAQVSGNGAITLAGYAGSPLTELSLAVNDYAALLNMVKTDYAGRVVDILDVTKN